MQTWIANPPANRRVTSKAVSGTLQVDTCGTFRVPRMSGDHCCYAASDLRALEGVLGMQLVESFFFDGVKFRGAADQSVGGASMLARQLQ